MFFFLRLGIPILRFIQELVVDIGHFVLPICESIQFLLAESTGKVIDSFTFELASSNFFLPLTVFGLMKCCIDFYNINLLQIILIELSYLFVTDLQMRSSCALHLVYLGSDLFEFLILLLFVLPLNLTLLSLFFETLPFFFLLFCSFLPLLFHFFPHLLLFAFFAFFFSLLNHFLALAILTPFAIHPLLNRFDETCFLKPLLLLLILGRNALHRLLQLVPNLN
mmetsp:Transcript_48245/g.76276  ORF Transcript_48245/g.76276 Transcript_48245/m.76276 type:complete len:223 (-) Transcript_48245:1549-2217(-)